ncbi:MAG TPA: SDR family oxidoreductase [Sphingobium sp.]|uniref:SDR family NAD(P)-dependent oxidoreductase n=1 Tax=Sphingobium sp. TaxID=1912891 RepID=UPI002ED62BEA
MRLANRVALVTGASRGIGTAIARKLAAEGARVILHASAPSERLSAAVSTIREAGGVADSVTGDLTTSDAPVRIVEEALAIHGALDILVCNAGGGGGGLVTDQTIEQIDATLALNLRSVILSTTRFAQLTQSPHGRVILISSGMATHPAPGASVPSASKAGAEAFIRSAAQELGQRGITCNSIAPGTTATERLEGLDWMEKMPRWTALRRMGQPDDIADIVAFIASDEARWLTGVTIPANGGQVTSAANIIAYG